MFSDFLLSLLIWVPIFGGIVCIAMGHHDRNKDATRVLATFFAVVTLALCVPLYTGFHQDTWHMQFVENVPWIPAFNIRYSLGIDGISLLFIILSCFTNLVIILASYRVIDQKVAQFMAVFLISTGIVNGAFAARDSILFYIFYEASIIPMYLGIGIWGGPKRAYAAIKLFLYTFLGSVFLLLGFLYLHGVSGSFDMSNFELIKVAPNVADWLFLAFLLAFAVKIPMWPVHTWLPDAHSEAPSGGSVVLAALMLKLGAYGFIRFSLPVLPGIHESMDWFLMGLSLIAIVYVGLACIVQTDMKRLIAYSSISHMGLVTLAIFAVFLIAGHTNSRTEAVFAIQGAVFQMLAHAFSSGGLFISVGYIYDRFHSRMIKDFQGLAHSMPALSVFLMLFVLANVGLPGTSGFTGELMIIFGVFKANFWIGFIAALTLILAPAYTIWMYQRVLFGELKNRALSRCSDVTELEFWVLMLLAVPVILFGIYPLLILNVSHASVLHFVDHVMSHVALGA
ncbi:MAG: NADH-quinone oxidoreductase subunit M [Gammaproteobacteria bacterium]|nr:NADH-quinone oxidoreductase subunit M [Gammaproteobacteria bacterium]